MRGARFAQNEVQRTSSTTRLPLCDADDARVWTSLLLPLATERMRLVLLERSVEDVPHGEGTGTSASLTFRALDRLRHTHRRQSRTAARDPA